MYHSHYVLFLFFFFILITPLFISNIFFVLRLHLCCIPLLLLECTHKLILQQCCGLNVCVSSNLYIEILIPNVTILGSRVFKRSVRVVPSWRDLCPYKRGPCKLACPFYHVRKLAVWNPEEGLQEYPTCWHHDLDFQPPELRKINSIVYKLPGLWYFVMVSWMN